MDYLRLLCLPYEAGFPCPYLRAFVRLSEFSLETSSWQKTLPVVALETLKCISGGGPVFAGLPQSELSDRPPSTTSGISLDTESDP